MKPHMQGYMTRRSWKARASRRTGWQKKWKPVSYTHLVYYDNHSAASAHGHKTWEAFIADSNGSNEVTVTNTTTKKILYVTLGNTGFDAVARANLCLLYTSWYEKRGFKACRWYDNKYDCQHEQRGKAQDVYKRQLLQRGGYRIKVLNTINFKKSMRYNPFAYARHEVA